MESTINQRFTQFLMDQNISQKEFAVISGMSPATVSNIASGYTTQPKSDFLAAMAKHFPDVNLRWLLLGEGKMYHKEDETLFLKEPKEVYENGKDNDLTATIRALSETVSQLAKIANDVPALREEIEKLKARIQELERRK